MIQYSYMKLSKQLNRSIKDGFFRDQEEMDKLFDKLELKKLRKSISIKEAVKNRL